MTGQLPNSVNRLGNLQFLSVSENSLSGLPIGLTSLTKLEELQLSNNKFNEIPNEIFNDFQNLGKDFVQESYIIYSSRTRFIFNNLPSIFIFAFIHPQNYSIFQEMKLMEIRFPIGSSQLL